jgi:hypothetical protein
MKLAAAGAVLLTLVARFYFGVMTSDDAFITYRYARNLVESHGFVFNTGERVLGTSTPLYGGVIALVTASGLPVEQSSVVIATACDALAVIVLYLLLVDAGYRRSAAAGAALAGAMPLAIVPASAGMETALYGLLILQTFRLAAGAVSTGRTALLSASIAALGLCRPDGVLAAAIAIGGLALARPRVAWRAMWPVLIAAAVVAVVALRYYGTIVPQSVIAKSTADDTVWAGFHVLGELLLRRLHVVTTIVAVIGAAGLWRAAIAWRWLIAWWILYAVVFAATGAFLHADWYFVPLQAVYWGTVAAGIETLATRAFSRHAGIVIAAAAVILLAVAVRGWRPLRAGFAQVHAIREERYLEIGRAIAASDRPCNVAATEIGAIGYAFPGRIIDLGGLITPSAVGAPAARVLRDLDAQWLVTQNIYMPTGLDADPSFVSSFDLVRSIPLEPGRSTLVYKRRQGACRPTS